MVYIEKINRKYYTSKLLTYNNKSSKQKFELRIQTLSILRFRVNELNKLAGSEALSTIQHSLMRNN